VVPGTAANTGNALWVIWVPFERVVVLDTGYEKVWRHGCIELAVDDEVEDVEPLAVAELPFWDAYNVTPVAPTAMIRTNKTTTILFFMPQRVSLRGVKF
jgi:hypothetical protein